MKLGTKKPAIKKLGFKKLKNLGGIRLNTFKPVGLLLLWINHQINVFRDQESLVT